MKVIKINKNQIIANQKQRAGRWESALEKETASENVKNPPSFAQAWGFLKARLSEVTDASFSDKQRCQTKQFFKVESMAQR